MSLLEALLFEEYKDPTQVWVAQRADGLAGSATVNDPADGGVRSGPSIVPSSITYNPRLVLVLVPKHGYSDGQTVTVFGVDVGDGPSPYARGPIFVNAMVGNVVLITKISNDAFTFLTAGTKPPPEAPPNGFVFVKTEGPSNVDPGRRFARIFWPVAKAVVSNHGLKDDYQAINVQTSDPVYSGDTIAVGVSSTGFFYILTWKSGVSLPAAINTAPAATFSKYTFRFDDVMNRITDSMIVGGGIVRFGPTDISKPFQTRGLVSAYLKAIADPPPAGPSSQLMCGFWVNNKWRYVGSGMTATTIKLMFAADQRNQAYVFGRFESLSSVEINECTIDSNMAGQVQPANYKSVQSFAPVAVGGIAVLGEFLRAYRVRGVNFGTQSIPECFVVFFTGGYSNGVPLNANNIIEDCVVQNPSNNNTHETTSLSATGVFSSTGDPYQPQVAGNGQAAVARRNYLDFHYPSGTSSRKIQITGFIFSDPGSPGQPDANGRFKVTIQPDPSLQFGNSRTMANNLTLSNILYAINAQTTAGHPVYNDAFPIVAIISDSSVPPIYTITCQVFEVPSPWPTVGNKSIEPINPVTSGAVVGVDFHGPLSMFGTGGVTEGNAVYDCTFASYQDTGSTRDMVIRNNYWSDVNVGIYQNLPANHTTVRRSLSSVTKLSDQITVEVDTAPNPHYLVVGDAVNIEGILVGVSPNNVFNDDFFVTSVVSATKFQYRLTSSTSLTPTIGALPPSYLVYWETRRTIIEGNAVDLYKISQYTGAAPEGFVGIVGGVSPTGKALTRFPGWVFRENLVRHTDGIPTNLAGVVSPAGYSYAIGMLGLDGGVVDSNVVDVENSFPLQYASPRTKVQTFNNLTAAGKPVLGSNVSFIGSTPEESMDAFLSRIEDAMFV